VATLILEDVKMAHRTQASVPESWVEMALESQRWTQV